MKNKSRISRRVHRDTEGTESSPKRPSALSIAWIPALAEPYFRGYAPRPQRSGALRGYWFTRPGGGCGFFLGFLVAERGWKFLVPAPPECVAFAFVRPVGGRRHRQLVAAPRSLLRETCEYIRWLTHRPPRFEFHADQTAVLIRHAPMAAWLHGKRQHLARNFYIESCCWLVRSALVRRLLRLPAAARDQK